jgi:hypothetical protein
VKIQQIKLQVSTSTIRNHLNETSSSNVRGRPPVFTSDKESVIVDFLINISKMGYSIDICSFRKVIKDFVVNFKKIRLLEMTCLEKIGYQGNINILTKID